MTFALALAALVLGTAGAILLYLASPQQQWRARGPWPPRPGGCPGSACALASLLLTRRLLPPVETGSAWAVLLMLVLSLVPFVGGWRARVRARRPA